MRRNPMYDHDRYTRVELLGSGGVAEVYLAHDELLDRPVALKVLKKPYASDPAFVQRFGRLARSAARLSHPGIVPVYEHGPSGFGAYYVASEYAAHGTLADRLRRRGGALEPAVAAGVTLQVAEALAAAHVQGVLHGDLRPRNVLVARAGELKGTGGDVKVADFAVGGAASASPVAAPVAVLEDAAYVSPEQASGGEARPASDLYSLGVVLFEMLTGELPYGYGGDPVALAMKHVNEPARSPRKANPEVPGCLEAVTLKLLAKSPQIATRALLRWRRSSSGQGEGSSNSP